MLSSPDSTGNDIIWVKVLGSDLVQAWSEVIALVIVFIGHYGVVERRGPWDSPAILRLLLDEPFQTVSCGCY